TKREANTSTRSGASIIRPTHRPAWTGSVRDCHLAVLAAYPDRSCTPDSLRHSSNAAPLFSSYPHGDTRRTHPRVLRTTRTRYPYFNIPLILPKEKQGKLNTCPARSR